MIHRRWSAGRVVALVLIVVAAEVAIYWGALAGMAWLERGTGRGTLAATAAYAAPALLIAQVAVPVVVYRLLRPRGPDSRGQNSDDRPRLPNALDR